MIILSFRRAARHCQAAIKPFYHLQHDAPRAIKDSEHPPMDNWGWRVLSWDLEEEGGIGKPNCGA